MRHSVTRRDVLNIVVSAIPAAIATRLLAESPPEPQALGLRLSAVVGRAFGKEQLVALDRLYAVQVGQYTAVIQADMDRENGGRVLGLSLQDADGRELRQCPGYVGTKAYGDTWTFTYKLELDGPKADVDAFFRKHELLGCESKR